MLPGGYITWYTTIADAPIWQAVRGDDGKITVAPLPGPTSAYTRHGVDYANDFLGALEPTTPANASVAEAEDLARKSAERYGAEVRKDLDRVLDSYEPTVDLDKFLAVLDRLAHNRKDWQTFNEDPNALLDELKGILPGPLVFVGEKLPSQTQYQAVYEPLKRLKDRQAGVKLSPEAAITAMQEPPFGRRRCRRRSRSEAGHG